MRHATIAAVVWAVAACALPAKADEPEPLIVVICHAGRGGLPLKDAIPYLAPQDIPPIIKQVWEGCLQETKKDLSCYPFIIDDDNRRITFMPGKAPPEARYEPWVADCRGRTGRWPTWYGAKEDPDETARMAIFYRDNPPGELHPPR
jgi:hypothetical protein